MKRKVLIGVILGMLAAGTLVSANEPEKVIRFEGSAASAEGSGIRIRENTVTITENGTYRLSGEGRNLQILVEADCNAQIRMILNGLNLWNESSSPISVRKADKVILELEEDTINDLRMTSEMKQEDSPKGRKAVIDSVQELMICGEGSLHVQNDSEIGISCKKNLLIEGGEVSVTAAGHGLKGKDSVQIRGGNLLVISDQDGIFAKRDLKIEDGSVEVKALNDALHSDEDVWINGGNITIRSGDDGIHADKSLRMDGGKIRIENAYEGMEAEQIEIADGEISIKAMNDGINAAVSDDEEVNEETGGPKIAILGGEIYIKAEGDGLDSNKDLWIEGGSLVVDGPGNGDNAAIDISTEKGGAAVINGGKLLAVGNAAMAQMFSEQSGQCSFLYVSEEVHEAGEKIRILDSKGEILAEHIPANCYDCILFSCSELRIGDAVSVQMGAEEESFMIRNTSWAEGKTDALIKMWGE